LAQNENHSLSDVTRNNTLSRNRFTVAATTSTTIRRTSSTATKMAHYLTPSKVALLTLLDLYTEDPLPPSSHLPILTFLTTHLTDPSPSTSSSSATSRFSKATTITSLLTSITPFRTLLEPHQLTTGIPGRRLYDSFVFRLWHINSLSALYEFFGRLPEALLAKSRDELRRMNLSEEKRLAVEAEVRFSRTSRFGLFVRNCCAEFEAARFDQVAELWKSLVAYRQETVDHLRKKVGEVDEYSFDSVLLSGQQEDWGIEGVQTLERVVYGEPGRVQGGKASVSRDDVEKLLEFQIDKMQSAYSIPFLPLPRLLPQQPLTISSKNTTSASRPPYSNNSNPSSRQPPTLLPVCTTQPSFPPGAPTITPPPLILCTATSTSYNPPPLMTPPAPSTNTPF